MNRWLGALAAGCGLFGGALAAGLDSPGSLPSIARSSGIELQYFDSQVSAREDFYRHVNGQWLDHTEMPPDKAEYDQFNKLIDDTQDQLRVVVEGVQHGADPADPDQQKIADLYASFMDEAGIESAGLRPLAAELARIDALRDKHDVAALIAHFNRIGVAAPCTPNVHQDARDSKHYVFDLGEDGLGMPDRDYYLQGDKKLRDVRARYVKYVRTMLALAGEPGAAGAAREIVALETALARAQWSKVQNRDPIKTYNRVALNRLAVMAPGIDWVAYLGAAGVGGQVDYLVISQPSYVAAFDRILQHTPLAVWKTYFRWHLINEMAPYLSQPFVREHFSFYGVTLRGIEQNKPRWKRGIATVEQGLGEALGRLYVSRYFPPQAKARMDQLVQNVLAAYQSDIDTLAWMSAPTKLRAHEKLSKFTTKIGYPATWRDYSELRIEPGDLIGNVLRASSFEYERNLHKLGRPVDRAEWEMTPQTVNAYYNVERNEIVFPAAILQPPFFNAQADDAVNYGAIGAIIGHEISHGFDDEGSQYDGNGDLLDPPGWFTTEDLTQFKTRTAALVKQFAALQPVPGYPINGELTLGENIADNAGLSVAYKAYQYSLHGSPAPRLDGLTGEQRFFIGWAQAWRGKVRENEAIVRIKSDPHSPDQIRGQVPPMNLEPFYAAFGIQPGDKMYLSPSQRVTVW